MATPQFDVNTFNIPGTTAPAAAIYQTPSALPVVYPGQAADPAAYSGQASDPTAYPQVPVNSFVPEQAPPAQFAPPAQAQYTPQYQAPAQFVPPHMATNPGMGQQQPASSPYVLTNTVTGAAPQPQLNLPAAPAYNGEVAETPTNVVEAAEIEEARIRYFEPSDHTMKDPSGKDIKYYKISSKYIMKSDVDEFYVNLPEFTAPDGIRASVYEKKDGERVLLDKYGKPITNTEYSIRVSFLKSNEKHAAGLKGLDVVYRALVKALYTYRHRVNIGDFDPERSDSTLKPMVPVPKDKNTGVPLDISPSMFLKVHKKKRTQVFYGKPGEKAVLMTGDQADILIDRQFTFIPTLHITGLYVGAKASIQSSVISLFVFEISQKIDPSIYKRSGSKVNDDAVTKLTEQIAKLLKEQEDRKKHDREQLKLEAPAVQSVPPQYAMGAIPAGANGFAGLPGGQIGGQASQYGYPGQSGPQHGAAPQGYGQNPMAMPGQQMPPQGYGQQMAPQGYGQPPMNAQGMQAFTSAAPARYG